MKESYGKFSLAPSPDYVPLHPGQRLIVIGDIHGDYDLLVQRLNAGGVLDENLCWKRKESAIVVQVGDILDRGSRELECLELLSRLSHEAVPNGGAVIVLWGNHELMNVSGDFRCVLSNDPWKREFDGFFAKQWGGGWKKRYFTPSVVHDLPTFPARWAACQPGGILSTLFFAQCKVAVQVGQTVCVHAHWDNNCFDEYHSIAEANSRVRQWALTSPRKAMSGDERFLAIDESMDAALPILVPFWGSSKQTWQDEIKATLSRFNNTANRLVVGHERVSHVRPIANGNLWKVDSQGLPQVLEVTHLDAVKVLRPQATVTPGQQCAKPQFDCEETLWHRLARVVFTLWDKVNEAFRQWIRV